MHGFRRNHNIFRAYGFKSVPIFSLCIHLWSNPTYRRVTIVLLPAWRARGIGVDVALEANFDALAERITEARCAGYGEGGRVCKGDRWLFRLDFAADFGSYQRLDCGNINKIVF